MKLRIVRSDIYKCEWGQIEYRKDQICYVDDPQAKDMIAKGFAEQIVEKAISPKNYENKAIVPNENKSESKPKEVEVKEEDVVSKVEETKDVPAKAVVHEGVRIRSNSRKGPLKKKKAAKKKSKEK